MQAPALISADDHLIEPPSIWTDRLPQRLQDVAPRVVEVDGTEKWVYEGKQYATVGLYATAGKKPEEFSMDPLRYTDMPKACYDPVERAKVMDEDGVRMSLLFPTFPRTCGQTFMEGSDPELGDLCVKAWNDYILDEWCGGAPGRFIPMIIGQLWDPRLMAAEVRRCAAKGAKALSFSENPTKLGLGVPHAVAPDLPRVPDAGEDWDKAFANQLEFKAPDGLPSFFTRYWDPLWEALVETDLAVCLHIGSSSEVMRTGPDAPFTSTLALQSVNAWAAAVDLMLSPIPRRFPQLKFVLSESAICWVPFALEFTDDMWRKHRFYSGSKWIETPPSEIWRSNLWACLIDEQVGVEMRHHIGVDKILWECDYPHSDTSYPNSTKVVAENLRDCTQAEFDAITHGNAERVFNL